MKSKQMSKVKQSRWTCQFCKASGWWTPSTHIGPLPWYDHDRPQGGKCRSIKLSAIASKLIDAGHFDLVQQIIKVDAVAEPSTERDLQTVIKDAESLIDEAENIDDHVKHHELGPAKNELTQLQKNLIPEMLKLLDKVK